MMVVAPQPVTTMPQITRRRARQIIMPKCGRTTRGIANQGRLIIIMATTCRPVGSFSTLPLSLTLHGVPALSVTSSCST